MQSLLTCALLINNAHRFFISGIFSSSVYKLCHYGAVLLGMKPEWKGRGTLLGPQQQQPCMAAVLACTHSRHRCLHHMRRQLAALWHALWRVRAALPGRRPERPHALRLLPAHRQQRAGCMAAIQVRERVHVCVRMLLLRSAGLAQLPCAPAMLLQGAQEAEQVDACCHVCTRAFCGRRQGR